MEVLCLFCYVLLCVHSSFAIILKGKLVALLLLSYRCIFTIIVMWPFLMEPWVGLQCVIVVFPDHTHLLLDERFSLCETCKFRAEIWLVKYIQAPVPDVTVV